MFHWQSKNFSLLLLMLGYFFSEKMRKSFINPFFDDYKNLQKSEFGFRFRHQNGIFEQKIGDFPL